MPCPPPSPPSWDRIKRTASRPGRREDCRGIHRPIRWTEIRPPGSCYGRKRQEDMPAGKEGLGADVSGH